LFFNCSIENELSFQVIEQYPAGRNCRKQVDLFLPLPTPFSPSGGIFVPKSSTGYLLVKINFIVTEV